MIVKLINYNIIYGLIKMLLYLFNKGILHFINYEVFQGIYYGNNYITTVLALLYQCANMKIVLIYKMVNKIKFLYVLCLSLFFKNKANKKSILFTYFSHVEIMACTTSSVFVWVGVHAIAHVSGQSLLSAAMFFSGAQQITHTVMSMCAMCTQKCFCVHEITSM